MSEVDIRSKLELDWLITLDPHVMSSENPEVKRDLIANVIITDSEGATTKIINYFSG